MFRKKQGGPPDRPFSHSEDCRIARADPDVEIPWSRTEGRRWQRICQCGEESWYEPVAGRARLDPRDPSTALHAGQCEFASETDPAVLKVLLKVKPGLGEGYSWVECGACGFAWPVPDFAEDRMEAAGA
jgi:hypothetical protein